MSGEIHDGEARKRLIVWLRKRMAEFGITTQALADSIQHDRDHAPVYGDASGNEWNGMGAVPGWLQAACNAGVNPDFFGLPKHRMASRPNASSTHADSTCSVGCRLDGPRMIVGRIN
jgi:DNA-binding protein H-NS